jgi:hypothetical protein
MYYSATIVEMAGLSSSRTTNIWIAVAINAVNFLFSFPGEQSHQRRFLKSSLQSCFTCAQKGIFWKRQTFFSLTLLLSSFSHSLVYSLLESLEMTRMKVVFDLGMYLIERLGRRTLTLISLAGIILSLILLGTGFQLARSANTKLLYKILTRITKEEQAMFTVAVGLPSLLPLLATQ